MNKRQILIIIVILVVVILIIGGYSLFLKSQDSESEPTPEFYLPPADWSEATEETGILENINESTNINETVADALSECVESCKNIPFGDNTPEITDPQLNYGWYRGQLDQKLSGTPDDWIHYGEGTRSATWVNPDHYEVNCDCELYFD